MSSLVFSDTIENKVYKFSLIDFSNIDGNEYFFTMGYQSNINSYFFSIDKLTSDNLVLSTKISKISSEDFGVYNQNTLLLKNKNMPIYFILSMNYLLDNSDVYRWTNLGLILNYKIKKKYNFIIGSYSDIISSHSQLFKYIKFFFGTRMRLSNRVSLQISCSYNPEFLNYNSLIEFGVKI